MFRLLTGIAIGIWLSNVYQEQKAIAAQKLREVEEQYGDRFRQIREMGPDVF